MASVRFLTAALAPLVIAALPAAAAAQTAPYKEGSVWAVTLVRVKPGMEDDYLNNLRASWQRTLQEAKRQGLLLSSVRSSGSAPLPCGGPTSARSSVTSWAASWCCATRRPETPSRARAPARMG